MDVEQVIQRHLAARGGLDKIQAIRSIVQEGTITNGSNTMPMRVCKKRPNYLLVTFTPEEQTGREGWDGQTAWEYFPWRDSEPVIVSDVPETALRRASDFDGPLVNWAQKGHTLEYLGESQIDQRTVHLLRVTLTDGNEIIHYLDRDTWLVAGTRTRRGVHGSEPVEITHRLEDYRQVAGVFYAFTMIEMANDGQHQEIIAWKG